MDTFVRFLFEFLSVFFNGIGLILKGIVNGFIQMFNFGGYKDVILYYKDELNGGEWALTIVAIVILLAILVLIGLLIFFLIRKYIRFRKTVVEQESMLEEVANLNQQVSDLMSEKEKILAMKVSQLGLKPGESPTEEPKGQQEEEEKPEDDENIRFAKLHAIDVAYKNYKVQNYNNAFTLPCLLYTSDAADD